MFRTEKKVGNFKTLWKLLIVQGSCSNFTFPQVITFSTVSWDKNNFPAIIFVQLGNPKKGRHINTEQNAEIS